MARVSFYGPGRRLRRVATGCTLALALLAGCGDSKSSEAGGTDGTPSSVASATIALPADQPARPACGLLSPAEVETAIGAKVSAGKPSMVESRSACGFTLGSAADQSVLLVSTSSSGVPAAFDAAREKADAPQTINAGDQAFVSGAQALVRKGNTMVAILVAVRQPPAQLTAAATRLAQTVGTHL